MATHTTGTLPGDDRPATSTPKAVDGIRVGIGGWVYPDWRGGTFYPKGLVQRRELEYASRHLTTIEINGTYYGAQAPATYEKWRDQTPPGFVLSVKAPMRIVHARTLARIGGQVDDFIGGIAALGDRLGPLVWQFDEDLPLDRDDFARFLELLPRKVDGLALRHVLDVRVPAFVDADHVALARKHGMATVYTDSDEYPSFADVTSDVVYARLMRSQLDVAAGYPTPQLARWAARARQWAAGGAPDDLPSLAPLPAGKRHRRDVFVYFIGAGKARNPAAAMALQALLQA